MNSVRIYKKFVPRVRTLLRRGGVGIIPTDTIYGMVGSALLPSVVGRIYRLRKRSLRRPMIVLLAGTEDLGRFGVRLSKKEKAIVGRIWPGPVSVVLPCWYVRYKYLHRGGETIAFRVPRNRNMRQLLKIVGPLIAPSANMEGGNPAQTIEEAQGIFGASVDFYVDGGIKAGAPSSVLAIQGGKIKKLR